MPSIRLPDLVNSEYPNYFDHCSLSPLFFFIYIYVCVCVCLFLTHKVIFCGMQLVNPAPGNNFCIPCYFDSTFQERLMLFYLGTQVSRALLLGVFISSPFVQDPEYQLL